MTAETDYVRNWVIKAGLFFRRRDNWTEQAVTEALDHPDIQACSTAVVERVALLCWLDKDCEHPGQLVEPGPWWTRAGVKPPSARVEQPVKGQSSPEARAATFAALQEALNPNPRREEGQE